MSSHQTRSKTKVAQPVAASSSKFSSNHKAASSNKAGQDTASQHTKQHRRKVQEACVADESTAGEGFRNFLVNLLPDSAQTCIAPIALRVHSMVHAAAKGRVDGK